MTESELVARQNCRPPLMPDVVMSSLPDSQSDSCVSSATVAPGAANAIDGPMKSRRPAIAIANRRLNIDPSPAKTKLQPAIALPANVSVGRAETKRGLLAVMLVRLVPIAPFPVVNLALGALRVRLPDFVVSTVIGMLPGTLATTVLSDQVAAAIEDPTRINGWLIAIAIAGLGTLAYVGQRWLRRQPG